MDGFQSMFVGRLAMGQQIYCLDFIGDLASFSFHAAAQDNKEALNYSYLPFTIQLSSAGRALI